MRAVGEILQEKRRELNLTLVEVEKETKIRVKYLEAIEKNNFALVGESTVAKGFVRNYAQALGLSPESLLAVFRRDYCENEDGQIIPRGAIEPLSQSKFYWTPRLTYLFIVMFLFGGVIFFFGKQFLSATAAPFLEISSPVEGETYREKIMVSGKTDRDATVKIEGTLVTIDKDGNFKEEVVLPRGENTLTIETANRQGKKRIVSKKIKVD